LISKQYKNIKKKIEEKEIIFLQMHFSTAKTNRAKE
jgi:hypothetical protein